MKKTGFEKYFQLCSQHQTALDTLQDDMIDFGIQWFRIQEKIYIEIGTSAKYGIKLSANLMIPGRKVLKIADVFSSKILRVYDKIMPIRESLII